MVSTRAVKCKFTEGERVLCYEPDPTKAKVLYEAKILECVNTLDSSGKRTVKYLVHFQGWNSSWDRYVMENLVLKDVDENRELQFHLAQKANVKSLRKDRRSHKPSCSENTTSSDESSSLESDTSSDQEEPELIDIDPNVVIDELIPIVIPDKLKEKLEEDLDLVKHNNKLPKLPAKPTIGTVLQDYVKHYTHTCEKAETKRKTASEFVRENIQLCQEMADGVRILIDFLLETILLYNEETHYFKKQMLLAGGECTRSSDSDESDDASHTTEDSGSSRRNRRESPGKKTTTKKSSDLPPQRTLRSHNSGKKFTDEAVAFGRDKRNSQGDKIDKGFKEEIEEEPVLPSQICHSIYLLRLFVKLPEIIAKMQLPQDRRKHLLNHLQILLRYLEDNADKLFNRKFYVSK